MKEKTTILKICLFMLIFIGLAIFAPSSVEASTDWTTMLNGGVTIGYKNTSTNEIKLVGTDDLYCAWYGGNLESYEQNKYYARYKVVIKGKQAYLYKGTTSGSYTSYKYITNSGKKDANAIMSYILSGGSTDKYGNRYKNKADGEYTNRQKAIYYYWNTWLSSSGLKSEISYNSWKNSVSKSSKFATNFIEYSNGTWSGDAYDYAKNEDSDNKIAEISLVKTDLNWKSYSTSSGKITFSLDENDMLGPFKVTFSGSASLSITGLSSGYTICNSSGTKISITSGTKFYIKLDDPDDASKIKKIVIKVTATSLQTTMWLLSTSDSSEQRLIAVETDSCTTSAQVTITTTYETRRDKFYKI